MLPSTRKSIRQLLIRPAEYFDRRRPADTLPYALVLVGCLAIASLIATFVGGAMLAGGSPLYEATTDYALLMFFAPFLIWIVGGLALNAAGRVAGGSPSVAGTFALAGWAALPEFFRLAVGLAALRYALWNTAITSVEQAPAAFEAALAPVRPIVTLVTVGTVVWQWYLLSGGLSVDADIGWRPAGVVVGVPMGIWLLLALP